MADAVAGKLSLVVPTLFDYEITNALEVAITKGRITEPDAQSALADFRLLSFERVEFILFQDVAFGLAIKHNRTVYDSAYLALAQSRGVWFFTGDKRLFNAINNSQNWIKWIGDYQFDVIP
jgi:predicted nucleic acid-binding protein